MRASDKQNKICKLIQISADLMINSDIDDPTHVCDIDELVSDDTLSQEEQNKLSTKLKELYFLVRELR